ncbi:MAG: hypothetical protein K6C95_10965 [Lachnospiraceae bacterium]|nr:hypothetical protein [Lachnospiraceae bacterium]
MAFSVEKPTAAKLAVGVAIKSDSAQVSFLRPGSDEPETLSDIAGTEAYDIPLALARRKNGGQWIFGRDAVKAVAEKEAEGIGRLYELALEGGEVNIAGESFLGVSLLALYVRKLLALLVMDIAGPATGLDVIGRLVLTVDVPDEGTAFTDPVDTYDQADPGVFKGGSGNAGRMMKSLASDLVVALPESVRISWCTFSESLFYYMKNRPSESGGSEVLAFSGNESGLVSYRYTVNHNTKPFVAMVARSEEEPLPDEAEDKDRAMLRILEESISGHEVSAVFFLGSGFDESWLGESLEYACRGRRVFLGNNLFSRGAVYAVADSNEAEDTAFLGPDSIRANVGIRVRKQGNSHYRALLDAGRCWYQEKAQVDVILEKDPRVVLEVTPLSDGITRSEVLELDGLELGPGSGRSDGRVARVRMEVTMFSPDRIRLAVTDQGFGDMFPSEGGHWERFIPVETGSAPARTLEKGVVEEPVLCVGRMAVHPCEFVFMDVRVFSVEELLYFIKKNDYLLTLEHIPAGLEDWIEHECGLAPLADRLRELKKRGTSLASRVSAIMDYVGLFASGESRTIEETLRDGDARDSSEKKLKITEYLIREGRLSEAYGQIRAFQAAGPSPDPIVNARLAYDEGVIYTRLFNYGAAAVCMEKAFRQSGDPQVKEAYLAALRLSMDEENYINAIGTRPELSPESLTFETRLGETLDLFAAGADNHFINTLSVYLDTGKLMEFDRETADCEKETVANSMRMLGRARLL